MDELFDNDDFEATIESEDRSDMRDIVARYESENALFDERDSYGNY
jgi:hypothetical protein